MIFFSTLTRTAASSIRKRGEVTLLRGWLRRGAFVLVALSLSSVALLSLFPARARAAIVERIVAVIGGRAILLTDVRERAYPILVRIYGTVPEGPQRTAALSQVYGAVLTRMVDEELEELAAKKSGVAITAEEVDAALARVSAQNNMSVNQILSEAKRSGLTIHAYREELRRQLLQAKMGQLRLTGRIRVTETDLRTAYRRLKMQERMQATQRTLRLRIPVGGNKSEKAAQKLTARSLAGRAKKGESFRELIEKHAASTGSGLADPLPPLQEPKNIQRATMALEVGETSMPVRDGNDWLILQVIERAPSQLPAFNEVRGEVHQQLYMEKMGAARKNWLKSLRRRTHVEIRM